MPTITLGQRPKSFARIVKFTDVDGSEQLVPVTYTYRTRKEFGAWLDSLPPQPEAKDAMVGEGKGKKFSSEKYLELMSEWNAGKLAGMLQGWGLDQEFGPETVRQLCDELPAAAEAVIEQYRAAILEGHLGN